jgi:hypothetical protein
MSLYIYIVDIVSYRIGMGDNFVPYPDITDHNFYHDIFIKKEFYKTKAGTDIFKRKIEQVCNPEQFNLQSYQEFLRNYVSSSTPYNGVLAWYGTGAGKTCSAIQITEGLKEMVTRMGKKIFIIAKQQIQTNFWKELYDPNREAQEIIPGSRQCTGSTYYIPKAEERDPVKRKNRVISRINQVYEFKGMGAFANWVDIEVRKNHPDLGEYFSHSVFVFDEAHGLTGESKSKTKSKPKIALRVGVLPGGKTRKPAQITDKGILTLLHEILATSEGIKLVLLTATPMKDNGIELCDLLDLLHLNDKRPKVDRKKLFPTPDDVNEDYLAELVQGYVSYVRGENPVSFPEVREPNASSLYKPRPPYDESGHVIPHESWIHHTNLVQCPMSTYHYANYLQVIKNAKTRKPVGGGAHVGDGDADADVFEGLPDEDKGQASSDLAGLQASNFMFPTANENSGLSGNDGFKQAFERIPMSLAMGVGVGKTTSGMEITGKEHHVYRPYTHAKNILDIENIGKYSNKCQQFLNNVFNSPGFIYAYSDFTQSGAILLALALEANGYQRYKPKNKIGEYGLLYHDPKQPRKYRCAQCGHLKQHESHTKSNLKAHTFIQAYYVVFTGQAETHFSAEEIEVCNTLGNMNGHLIKCIVGTRVTGEGVDFKRLRQVHIIEPWHNYTRLYQVIGRAVRHCSHKDLPSAERNVTVFRYSSSAPEALYAKYLPMLKQIQASKLTQMIPINETDGFLISFLDLFTETSNEKVYRRIERKDLFIRRIERIMKISAVDCELNKNANQFPTDKDGSRECDYQKCDYQCRGTAGLKSTLGSATVPTLKENEINKDTYTMYFSEPQISQAQKVLFELFRYNPAMDLDTIMTLIHQHGYGPDLDDEFIYEALDRMVGHPPQKPPMEVLDRFQRTGHIYYAYPYYIFQPDDITDTSSPLYYRITPLTIKKRFLNLMALMPETEGPALPASNTNTNTTTASSISGSIAKISDQLLNQIKSVMSQVDSLRPYRLFALLDRLSQLELQQIYEYQGDDSSPDFRGLLNRYFIMKSRANMPTLGVHSGADILLGLDGSKPNSIAEIHLINPNQPRRYIGAGNGTHLWSNISLTDPHLITLKSEQLAKQPKLSHRIINELSGYIKANDKNGQHVFKIKDLTLEKNELNKVKITSKGVTQTENAKKKTRGATCKDQIREPLLNYLVTLGLTMDSIKNNNKVQLCELIELKLRERDEQDPKKIWFSHSAPEPIKKIKKNK